MFDIILCNGTVYDGSGQPGICADIGIVGDRIAAIGMLGDATAGEVVDVDGRAAAPGFFDLHTHSDFTLAGDARAESQIRQGVTSEVVGQCGVSVAPARSAADIELMAPGFTPDLISLDWRSFGSYLDHLDGVGLSLNVAAFVGHGTVHRAVLGDQLRAANEEELAQIGRLVEQSCDEGAYGFSTGLEYWPGMLADADQLASLCAIAARKDVLYATHVRNRDVFYDLGFAEALATARVSGARLQISHIQPKFGAPANAMQRTLEVIRAAREDGIDVGLDVIPHDWSHTRILAMLPQWAQEGGTAAVARRLRDEATRERIKSNPRPMWRIVAARQWESIVLLYSEANAGLVGMTFADIGRRRNQDPYDAALDLLLEEGEAMNQVMWTSRSFRDEDICLALSDPHCAVMSDTLALANDGPLASVIGSLSGYGWAARFLQRYIREKRVLPLAEGLRRMTSLPASRLGITDRGWLRPGAFADITVFDPERIESRCNVTAPRAYASGVDHVLVNGGFALRDGERVGAGCGRVLRHG